MNVASNQTVLEVAKSEGISIPYACGAGTCGTCKFKVDKGQVNEISGSTPGITSQECADGYTLLFGGRVTDDAFSSLAAE